MKRKVWQLFQFAVVALGYPLAGCMNTGSAPEHSYAAEDSRMPEVAAGPEYASASLAPGQGPGPSSKMDLIKTAQGQQKFIRAAKRRISELQSHPPETSEQTDSLPSDERLLQMSPATLRKVIQRQQEIVDILRRRVDELDKKT